MAMLASFVAMAALNYSFAITMSWLLPVEQYGAIGVGQAVLLTGATVVGAGFPWALTRAVAQAKSRQAQGRAFRAALLGNCILGLGLSVVVAVAAITGRVEPASIYSPILLIASTVIAVLALNAVLSGALQGLLLLRELALVRVIEVVIKAIAGLLLVLAGLGVAGAMGGFLLGAIVATVVAAVMLRGFPFGAGGSRIDRTMFMAAGPFFVAMVGFALMSQMDILTLKAFTPAPAADLLAGQYQVAITLGRIPYFAGLAVFGAIFPYVSRDARRSDDSRAYASLGLKYTALFILPVGLILAVVPDGVIRLFFASRYDRSAEALAVVALASVVLTISYGLATLLQARGRQLLPAVGLAIAVPTQLVVAALAVPVLGMIGAAMSMGVAAAVALAVLAPSAIRSFRLRTSASEVLRYAAALAVLAGTLAVLPESDRVTTAVSLALATALYLVALTVLRLITARDVETLGGALGSRGLPARRRIARAIDAIQAGRSLP
jgi:O-antigen/teichoic acid export membrane protein